MKNRTSFIVPTVLLGLAYIMFSYNIEPNKEYENIINTDQIEIPSDVQSVLDDKCMSCHNSESKGSKSKLKLNFDKFTNGDYSTGKLVSKLGKIKKQLDKNKMPPKKYLTKNPDKKLSVDEFDLIKNWAIDQGEILVGE